MGDIRIGEVYVRSGETAFGPATSVELRDTSRVNLPVIAVNGASSGPKVVLVAATHPPELIGPAALQILTRHKLDPTRLKGSVIAFPVANPLGMQFGEYVSPHDGLNMSSAYPGRSDGSPTSKFANFIWQTAQDADLVLDLHENQRPCLCFSMVHNSPSSSVASKAMELARAFGITPIRSGEAKLTLPGVKSTDKSFTATCMSQGIVAFAPEFEGGPEVWTFREGSNVDVGVKGITNVLRKLGMVDGEIEVQSNIKVLGGNYEAWGIVHSARGGFVDRLVETGTRITKGTAIARIIDPYGNELESIEMPIDGYIWGWTVTGGSNKRHASVYSGGNIAYVFRETAG